jgi:hypothetical protein
VCQSHRVRRGVLGDASRRNTHDADQLAFDGEEAAYIANDCDAKVFLADARFLRPPSTSPRILQVRDSESRSAAQFRDS